MHPDADPREYFSEGEVYEAEDGSRFVIVGIRTNGELEVTDPDDRHHQSGRAWSWKIDPWDLHDDVRAGRVRRVSVDRRDRNEWFPEI